jgi:hypothetical protein
MKDEFYIGWEAKSAAGTGKRMRRLVIVLLSLALLTAVALAAFQRSIGQSVFEWGTEKSFYGVLRTEPYPHLIVPRPGKTGAIPQFSIYYLVAPWKFGLDPRALAGLSGKPVTLRGTLIYRGAQTMIETKPEWIEASEKPFSLLAGETIRLGRQTLVGEIVDSKCFLGVMNPGQSIPHRACAIRCISGGIPPVLVVHQKQGGTVYLLLVSFDGKPVNEQVLDFIAEPVEITGEVERQSDLLILRADPASCHRVK